MKKLENLIDNASYPQICIEILQNIKYDTIWWYYALSNMDMILSIMTSLKSFRWAEA
jgi:hypothetical protein